MKLTVTVLACLAGHVDEQGWCWQEFTLAADSAWGLLKQECPPTLLKHHSLYCPWPKPGDPNSMAALIPDNDLVEQPQNLPLPTLKGICRNLNIAVSGAALAHASGSWPAS